MSGRTDKAQANPGVDGHVDLGRSRVIAGGGIGSCTVGLALTVSVSKSRGRLFLFPVKPPTRPLMRIESPCGGAGLFQWSQ